jgi:hypothetical protein
MRSFKHMRLLKPDAESDSVEEEEPQLRFTTPKPTDSNPDLALFRFPVATKWICNPTIRGNRKATLLVSCIGSALRNVRNEIRLSNFLPRHKRIRVMDNFRIIRQNLERLRKVSFTKYAENHVLINVSLGANQTHSC